MFNRLVGSLQAQIVLGPLNDLKAIGGATKQKINGNQYVAAVANMVQGFEAAATQEEPSNQKLDHLVLLQGVALDAQTVALNAKRNDGLVSDTPSPGTTSAFYNSNLTTVEHLTLSRPLWPYGTPILDYTNRTELFETDLATAVKNIQKLGIAAAANLAQIEAASFTADINLSTLQRPGLDTFMNQQVGTLLTQINAAAQSSGPSGAAAFAAAVQSFKTATYDKTNGAGILGPAGCLRPVFRPAHDRQSGTSEVTPLPYSTVNTFAYGRYKTKQLHTTALYHRNFGNTSNEVASNEYGNFVTTALYPNSAVAIRKSAIDQTFLPLPTAFYVEDVYVPAGQYASVGRVAPIYQGVLTPRNTLYPGLASQIVINLSSFPGYNKNDFPGSIAKFFVNQRTTGT